MHLELGGGEGLGGLEVTYLCYMRKYTVCNVTRKSASIPCFIAKLWSIVYVCRFPIDNKENTVSLGANCFLIDSKTFIPYIGEKNFRMQSLRILMDGKTKLILVSLKEESLHKLLEIVRKWKCASYRPRW